MFVRGDQLPTVGGEDNLNGEQDLATFRRFSAGCKRGGAVAGNRPPSPGQPRRSYHFLIAASAITCSLRIRAFSCKWISVGLATKIDE